MTLKYSQVLLPFTIFSIQAADEYREVVHHQRYARLTHLLEKSSLYTDFLYRRMQQQKVGSHSTLSRHSARNIPCRHPLPLLSSRPFCRRKRPRKRLASANRKIDPPNLHKPLNLKLIM